MNYIYLIHEHYPTLTKSEKKVANHILTVGNKIMYSTMSDIKKSTAVGDATIIRFCQKLGFSGFNDLKIEVAKEDFSQKKERPREKNDYEEIADSLNDALQSTASLVNPDSLEKAINFISESRSLYIFGVGSSGNTASDLETMLLRVGVQAKVVIDPHLQAQVASLLTEKDLVIAFSLSGSTKDTRDSVKIAKMNYTKVIAITNYLLSPLAQEADVVLQTAIEEFLNGGSLLGKISQLFICELLVHGYELRNDVNAIALREKVLRSIMDKSID